MHEEPDWLDVLTQAGCQAGGTGGVVALEFGSVAAAWLLLVAILAVTTVAVFVRIFTEHHHPEED